jgi:hypothetical protein
MGDIIQLPVVKKRCAGPFSGYLRNKRREERVDVVIFGLLGACAMAVIVFAAAKTLPSPETGEAKTNRLERIERLKGHKKDWAHAPGLTNDVVARS